MAVITRSMLDPAVVDTLSSLVKQRMFVVYGAIPISKDKVAEGLDDQFVENAKKEIVVYYDGLFDDNEVDVNISKKEYADLL